MCPGVSFNFFSKEDWHPLGSENFLETIEFTDPGKLSHLSHIPPIPYYPPLSITPEIKPRFLVFNFFYNEFCVLFLGYIFKFISYYILQAGLPGAAKIFKKQFQTKKSVVKPFLSSLKNLANFIQPFGQL